MNTQKIAANYANSLKSQSEALAQLNQALQTLGSDNQVFSLSEPVEGEYTQLVEEILGPELWEWLMWWMYDTDYGTRPMSFTINNQEYCPTQLSFEQFWSLVSA